MGWSEDDKFQRLLKAIKINTTSSNEESSFIEFHNFLKNEFPEVHQKLEISYINKLSLIYKWSGKNMNLDPILLVSHIDTVPVESPQLWKYHPFGEMVNGKIYGRGTMDVKSSLIAIVETVEKLVNENFTPNQTIYLAFGHDEEIGGLNGAKKIANHFNNEKTKFKFILDEGGAVSQNPITPSSLKTAFVGIAEKGNANFKINICNNGGHSSFEHKTNAVNQLEKILSSLPSHIPSKKIPSPIKSMCFNLVKNNRFYTTILKIIFKISPKLIQFILLKNKLTQALVSTKITVTSINSSNENNQLPTDIEIGLNARLIQGHSVNDIKRIVERIIMKNNAKINLDSISNEASPITNNKNELFTKIENIIIDNKIAHQVSPVITPGLTDSRHYQDLSETIFRFIPLYLNKENAHGIHGVDENISMEDYQNYLIFYEQVMKMNYE